MLFFGIIALFPVVNPIGSSFIISPYLSQLSDAEKKAAVKKITMYAFLLCLVSLFAGHWILELFVISIPVIQLAGGIMICKMGWDSLTENKDEYASSSKEENGSPDPETSISKKLFYPLTFPVTTGAGTISVLFTLSAHSADKHWTYYLVNTLAIVLAIIAMCILVYIFYSNTRRLMQRLGDNGRVVLNRVSAFLIFCVRLQIAISGLKAIFQDYLNIAVFIGGKMI